MSRRGPIYDYKEIISTGGKVWAQPSELISTYMAREIPVDLQVEGRPVKALFSQSPVSLLAVSYAAFSDPAIVSFTSQLPESFPQLLLRPILNPLKWLLWSRLIPKSPHSTIFRGDLPGADDVFEMYNKSAAYVFLIDSAGLIRWKAAGPATATELHGLQEAIKMLR